MNEHPFNWRDVLIRARKIVVDGGDPNPCGAGKFCLRCCAANAKGKLDDEHGTGVSPILALGEALLNQVSDQPSDAPLKEAVQRIAVKDGGIMHTQESALAMLDELIEAA